LRARWLERVRALPNVRNASLSVLTPLSGRNTGVAISVPGTTVRTQIPVNHVSVGYFTTFGIDVLAGRSFIEQDRAGSSKVVMLSASAARLLFAGRSPLGERIEFERAGIYQVIGVVRDHKHLSVREHAPAVAFVPLSQPVGPLGRLTLAVSSTAPGTTVANAAASEIRTVHRGTLISDPMTVNGQIDETLVGERLLSSLSTGFTVLVVALTIIGLYGTVGYSVATRTTEFGVRLALGAPRASVALDVLASAMSPVAIGIAVGLPIAATVARAAERLLFEVSAADATSYEFGAATMVVAACAAAWLPARRACMLDPAETLRHG
jgi:ABC-type antimicrobial peptide transport system permease subunit